MHCSTVSDHSFFPVKVTDLPNPLAFGQVDLLVSYHLNEIVLHVDPLAGLQVPSQVASDQLRVVAPSHDPQADEGRQ